MNEDKITVYLNSPTVKEPKILKKEDVWGDFSKESRGMRVAVTGEKCPIFEDMVEFKSATFVVPKELEEEAIYWIEFVYGGNCITKRKVIDNSMVALRGDYQCW